VYTLLDKKENEKVFCQNERPVRPYFLYRLSNCRLQMATMRQLSPTPWAVFVTNFLTLLSTQH